MPQFIGASMPAAFAGDLTRGFFDHTTEAKANDKTAPVTAFGVAVKFNSTKTAVCPVTAASDAVIGFAVRNYTQVDAAGAIQDGFVTVLKRGYMAVRLASGTAAAGGQVYLNASGAITASSSSATAITGCVFCGPAVDGIAEIAYNI